MGTLSAADGLHAFFDSSFSNAIGNEDSYKFQNQDENIAIVSNGTLLSIEGRQPVTANDTLKLKMWQLSQPAYSFTISMNSFDPNVEAYLEDAFTHSSTRLANDDTTKIHFNTTSDTASFANNRFSIVFKKGMVMPVQITSEMAYAKDIGVQVEWRTESETNISSYQVERSGDTRQFTKIGSAQPKNTGGNASYEFFDYKPLPSDNFYLVKSTDDDGKVKYSKVMRVKARLDKPLINVFPNPVTGLQFNAELVKLEKGNYKIAIINLSGKAVFNSITVHAGGTANYSIKLKKGLPSGVYVLQFTKGENTYKTPLVIE